MLKKLKIINKGGYTRQYPMSFKFIAYTSCVLGVDETATLYEFGYIDENQTTNPTNPTNSQTKTLCRYASFDIADWTNKQQTDKAVTKRAFKKKIFSRSDTTTNRN